MSEDIGKKNKIQLDVQKAIVDFQWLKKKTQMLGDYLYDEDDDLPDGEEVTLLFDYYHALCATQGILYQRISKMFLPIVDENEDIMEYISDEAMCGETFDESFGAFLYQNGGI